MAASADYLQDSHVYLPERNIFSHIKTHQVLLSIVTTIEIVNTSNRTGGGRDCVITKMTKHLSSHVSSKKLIPL